MYNILNTQILKDSLKSKISPYAFYAMEFGSIIFTCTGNGWQRVNHTCPFHNDKKPGTFHIHEKTGNYKCFACEASGDMFKFYMLNHNVDFKTALKELNERF